MKFIEVTGKTVEEAVASGLKELNKTKDQVEVQVIVQPTKGFLGLIGSRLAKVKLNVIDQPEDDARKFLNDMFKAMNLDVEMDIVLEEDTLTVNLEGPNMGVIIGRRGQTLDAVQYLLSLAINKERDQYLKVFIDTENYRKKREETLVRLAHKMARRVRKIEKTIALEPMNPYERRIIHASLQSNPYVQTYSEGEEPYRKVVIALRK